MTKIAEYSIYVRSKIIFFSYYKRNHVLETFECYRASQETVWYNLVFVINISLKLFSPNNDTSEVILHNIKSYKTILTYD